jgi:hypothetical protein
MGESDLLLGPHEQSIGGIGRTTHRRGGDPYASYGPHAPWAWRTHKIASPAPSPQHAPGLRRRHRDRRTASTPAIAAAAAKNIAKKSASYAHANPRLKQETSAIIVSSRTLASNPCPPLFREHTLALSRMNRGEREAASAPINCRKPLASTLSARSISRRQIKVIADEVRSFLPYLGQTRNDAPSAL